MMLVSHVERDAERDVVMQLECETDVDRMTQQLHII